MKHILDHRLTRKLPSTLRSSKLKTEFENGFSGDLKLGYGKLFERYVLNGLGPFDRTNSEGQ